MRPPRPRKYATTFSQAVLACVFALAIPHPAVGGQSRRALSKPLERILSEVTLSTGSLQAAIGSLRLRGICAHGNFLWPGEEGGLTLRALVEPGIGIARLMNWMAAGGRLGNNAWQVMECLLKEDSALARDGLKSDWVRKRIMQICASIPSFPREYSRLGGMGELFSEKE